MHANGARELTKKAENADNSAAVYARITVAAERGLTCITVEREIMTSITIDKLRSNDYTITPVHGSGFVVSW